MKPSTGNESVGAPQHVLSELIFCEKNRTYDNLSINNVFKEASFSVLRATYKLRTGTSFNDSDFASFGLIDIENMLTNAGVLLADEPSIRYSRIFCTRWNGLFKDDAIDDAEYSGSLLYLLRESESFIKRYNRTS